jgi:hypothetical protein
MPSRRWCLTGAVCRLEESLSTLVAPDYVSPSRARGSFSDGYRAVNEVSHAALACSLMNVRAEWVVYGITARRRTLI